MGQLSSLHSRPCVFSVLGFFVLFGAALAQAGAASTPAPRPKNLSSVLVKQTGNSPVVVKFLVTGTVLQKVLLRAAGPSLGQASFLQDPILDLKNNKGVVLASNDNWQSNPTSTLSDFQKNGGQPIDPREPALIALLLPGTYTATVRAKSGPSRVAQLEVFTVNFDPAPTPTPTKVVTPTPTPTKSVTPFPTTLLTTTPIPTPTPTYTNIPGGATLTLGGSSGSIAYAGSSTQTLSGGVNTYAGTTTISSGTILSSGNFVIITPTTLTTPTPTPTPTGIPSTTPIPTFIAAGGVTINAGVSNAGVGSNTLTFSGVVNTNVGLLDPYGSIALTVSSEHSPTIYTFYSNSGPVVLNGQIVLPGSPTITILAGDTLTWSGKSFSIPVGSQVAVVLSPTPTPSPLPTP
jgi:autotransporter-associated beta strand protein